MSEKLKVACVQLNSGPDIEENLRTASEFIYQAASDGAQFIATPENSCHMREAGKKLETALPEDEHKGVSQYANLAQDLSIWLLAGSFSVKVAPDKIANRSYLFNAGGDIVAKYDKIHLFDVDLPTGESHRESDSVRSGEKAVTAKTPWGLFGLSICYDVRFAHLFRALAQGGAKLMTVPAAFTVPTGKAHWSTLLRARAIETGSFVVAPAQCGEHEGNRYTYGHSMIIGPWGEVLAEAGNDIGYITAELDMGAVDKARSAIPALQHDRPFTTD